MDGFDCFHSEGMDAHYDGVPLKANPYRSGSPEFKAWRKGWLDAVDEIAEVGVSAWEEW